MTQEYQPADRGSPALWEQHPRPGARKHVVQEGGLLAASWKDQEGSTGGGHASGPWGRQEVSTYTHPLALGRAAAWTRVRLSGRMHALGGQGPSPLCSWPTPQQMSG